VRQCACLHAPLCQQVEIECKALDQTEAQPEKASKYRFVNWCKSNKKWRARLSSGGSQEHLGYFHTELEAAKAVDSRLRRLDRAAEVNAGEADDSGPSETVATCSQRTARRESKAERKAHEQDESEDYKSVAKEVCPADAQPEISCKQNFVHWCKDKKKWRARLRSGGTREHLGYFHTELEAAKAVDSRLRQLDRAAEVNVAESDEPKRGQSKRARRSTNKECVSKPRAESECKAGEQAEQAADAAKSAGDRIAVQWPLDKCAYTGTVTKRSGTHVFVVYDDGEKHWAQWEGGQWVDTAEVSGDDEPEGGLPASLLPSALAQSRANPWHASGHCCDSHGGAPKHRHGTGRSTVATSATKPEPPK
jgi:hypothetical protein